MNPFWWPYEYGNWGCSTPFEWPKINGYQTNIASLLATPDQQMCSLLLVSSWSFWKPSFYCRCEPFSGDTTGPHRNRNWKCYKDPFSKIHNYQSSHHLSFQIKKLNILYICTCFINTHVHQKLTPFPRAPHMFCELARPRRTVPEHLHKGWEQKRHMVEITNSTSRLNFDAYMQIKLSIYTILCVFL